MDKNQQLLLLAKKRQRTRLPGYGCIGDFHDRVYECDYVSPYTKSAGNVDATVMVLLQDWSSADRLSGPINENAMKLGHTPELPTNRNLVALLKAHFGFGLSDIYATNIFPFVKQGNLSARIPVRVLTETAMDFAVPQIEIVNPVIAACLGKDTFNALRRAHGAKPVATLEEGIRSPFFICGTEVWCQAHTGALGRINRNRHGVDRVTSDWARMAAAYNNRIQL